MSAFGWSYPPGCSGPPDDESCECFVCGKDEDSCICRRCREEDSCGDPACYFELADDKLKGTRYYHPPHMHMSAEQHRSRAEIEAMMRAIDAELEARYGQPEIHLTPEETPWDS